MKRTKIKKRKYWLLGATWDGNDMLPTFLKRKYWEMGYDDEDQPGFARLRNQMKTGDRVAIKKMNGPRHSTINIRALGTVVDVDPDEQRVYIKWMCKNIRNRHVHSKGCFATIHGPYNMNVDGNWLKDVFHI